MNYKFIVFYFIYNFEIKNCTNNNKKNEKQFILDEIHAELCYAEILMFSAILTFFADDNFSSFVRGTLKIRSCYQTYK